MTNQELRIKFKLWREVNYNPPLIVLAKEIGVGYQNLSSWNAGSLDYGKQNLGKIKKFLDEKGSK